MATQVIMPQMGESIAEGTITKWLKKVGDAVKRDEPIFEISTDKVDAEIPSPVAGTLIEIKVQEGATVAINTVVGVIGEASEKAAAAPAPAPAPAVAAAPKAPEPAPVAPPAPAPAPAPAAPAPAPPPPARAPEPAAARPAPAPVEATGGQVESIEERIRRRSSPLVRKIAQEHAIEVGEVDGTGIHNRVTKNDILSYIENRKVASAPAAAAAALEAPAPAVGRAEPAPAPAPAPLHLGDRPRRGRRDDEDPQDHGREHDPVQADLGPRHDRLPGRLHEHREDPRRSTRTTSSRRTASS